MWIKVWVIQQEYFHLNSKKNLSSLVNPMKFNYLESIESKTKRADFSAQRLMKVPSKRLLNRNRDTWVAGIDYWKHTLAVNKYLLTSFLICAQVNKQWVRTLIDISVMRDFMSPIFAKQTKIQLQQKKSRYIYKVTSIDDTVLSYN